MVGPSQNKTPGISRVTTCIRAFSLVAGIMAFAPHLSADITLVSRVSMIFSEQPSGGYRQCLGKY